LGGSATTDGGYGAVRAIHAPARLKAVEFLVACDVTTPFTQAAQIFGPQKGATLRHIALLTGRLERLQQIYAEQYGIDVSTIVGAGAAGGLAGGLAALGATLVPGFDVVAEEIDLDTRAENCDLIFTGEGFLDAQSFDGKVVGSMYDLALSKKKQLCAIVGDADTTVNTPFSVMNLVQLFGSDTAMNRTLFSIEQAALGYLKQVN
jgi:glycerate kinase